MIDNIYGDTTIADSADILLYDAAETSGIVVVSNILGNSQLPIAVYTDTASLGDGVSVTNNKIFGTSIDAVDVCTNGNTVKTNTVFISAESGVHLDASCGGTGNNNIVTGNTVGEAACAGILADTGTAGNTTTPNTYYCVPVTMAGVCTDLQAQAKDAILARPTPVKVAHKISPAR